MKKYISLAQVAAVTRLHLYISLAAAFAGVILPVVLDGIFKYIFSTVFILIYALAMYSKGEELAKRDAKSYTDEIQYKYKGLLLPAGIIVIWLVLLVLYKFSWKYDIVSYSSGFINNLLFAVWSFVYNGFMDLSNGSFSFYSQILFVLVPVAACGAGYFAGYKKFDLSVHIAELVYEKDESEKEE